MKTTIKQGLDRAKEGKTMALSESKIGSNSDPDFQMSGFLLRLITSGKMTENQKGAMLTTGKEPKLN